MPVRLSEELAMARDAFRGDCLIDYQIMPPTMPVIDLACTLLERHPLRACDAIHLATALGVHRLLVAQNYPALTFLSADDCLNDAAAAEDLAVDNPSRHP